MAGIYTGQIKDIKGRAPMRNDRLALRSLTGALRSLTVVWACRRHEE
jgi:hypothetical protein